MSIIRSHTLAGASGQAAGGYEIEQSLRFSTNEYLTRTNSTASTDGQYGTLSVWVKLAPSTDIQTVIEGSNSTYGHFFRYQTNNKTDLHIGVWGSVDGGAESAALFRDYSAWYHWVWQFDKTQSGVTTVNKLWVNGVAISETAAGNFSSQNWGITNNGNKINIGNYQANGSTRYGHLKSYLAEMHVIDGSLVAADQFGEYDDNGVWRPIPYTGTYGNNGFYLKFDPSATNGIGHDHSGNGNNFTATGFTTSGTGTDVMSDTPTTNYCTWNPITTNSSGVALSEGNLFAAHAGTNDYGVIGTVGVTSGKWYWEGQLKNFVGYRHVVGVTHSVEAGNPNLKDKSGDTGFWGSNITSASTFYIYENGSVVNYSASYPGSTPSSDSIMQFALDLDNLKWYIGFDGNWYNSGDPAAGTNATSTGLTSGQTWFPICELRSDEDSLWNFGQRAFAYTPPTGFKALNTSNLPAPDIADGSDYFTTLAYSGTSTTDSKVIEDSQGNDWAPDFVWLKKRNSGANNMLYDRVRGASKSLRTNTDGAEVTGATNGDLTAFTSTGFTLNSGNDVNASGNTYVAWNWLAANGTEVLTAGSINSTVSANPSAGFSIVSYTGNGSGSATIAHGLGVKPQMVIVKSRSNSSTYWTTYHESISAGTTYCLELNSTAYKDQVNGTFFGSTQTFNGTVFSVGYPGAASNSTNVNNYTYIAYCFAEVEGYSKFGSYTGNGSSDGPFVFCGFRPRWVLTKRTDSTSVWMLYDTARLGYNQSNNYLQPNTSIAEGSGDNFIDILSNGFKVRVGSQSINVSGGTYIFAAFAENPFGGSGVSPATAR